METIRVLQVDAFADEPLSGVPVGVVPDAGDLSSDQMRAIASELAPDETAFLAGSDRADRRVCYLGPPGEIDRSVPATVAAVAHLHDERLASGHTTIETADGVVDVDVETDGTVWLRRGEPTVREVDLAYDRVAGALGVDPAAIEGVGDDLPLAVAAAETAVLVVPATFLSPVGAATPDPAALAALCAAVDADGVYLFTFDTLGLDSTLHARAFDPATEAAEEPATVAASGAVAAYLDRFGALDGDEGLSDRTDDPTGPPATVRVEQGHYVGRPSLVQARLVDGVRIGGRGATSLDGTLLVPDDDGGILEV